MTEEKHFDSWCIIEIFGHQRLAGRVTEEQIGGQSFIRVDVPAVDGAAAFTKLYGPGAIYSITPTTEELVRAALPRLRPEPVSIYIPRLAAPAAEASAVNRDLDAFEGNAMDRLDDEHAHDCRTCGSPCDCGFVPEQCEECSACNPEEGEEEG